MYARSCLPFIPLPFPCDPKLDHLLGELTHGTTDGSTARLRPSLFSSVPIVESSYLSAEPLETREVGKGRWCGLFMCVYSYITASARKLSCIVRFPEGLEGGGAVGPRGVDRGS
jgi:hypothetical protein